MENTNCPHGPLPTKFGTEAYKMPTLATEETNRRKNHMTDPTDLGEVVRKRRIYTCAVSMVKIETTLHEGRRKKISETLNTGR